MQPADRAAGIMADAGIPGPADPLPDEPWTELGYAHRLVHVYGDQLRYVPEWRRWLVWTGQRWAPDATGQSARWMKVIARRITADALAETDDRKREALVRLARRGESSAGVSGALTLASTEETVVVIPDDLDADPFLLNTPSGVLDLRTGELGPHDPGLLLTKMTKGAYRPEVSGMEFGKFLRRVQPDEAMRAFLARLLGHALEGRVTEHVLPIFHGEGSNGKSTLINAVTAALGDYAAPADPDLLTARTFDAHPTGTADLCGLRLAILHEGDAGRRLAEGTVKRLTGGDRIKARFMRENFWSFDPSHTFLMLTNHRPIVVGQDEGIWRRLRLVPWDVVIPVEERDEQLPDRLALELDAILAWLVAGYLDWHRHGLGEPERVVEATAKYRAESDTLARFLDECCVPGHGTVGSTELFHAWQKWCADQGEDAGSQKALTTALENRGFDKGKDGTGRIRWRGLGLAAAEG
jgi:putative DNA primase/helicase